MLIRGGFIEEPLSQGGGGGIIRGGHSIKHLLSRGWGGGLILRGGTLSSKYGTIIAYNHKVHLAYFIHNEPCSRDMFKQMRNNCGHW